MWVDGLLKRQLLAPCAWQRLGVPLPCLRGCAIGGGLQMESRYGRSRILICDLSFPLYVYSGGKKEHGGTCASRSQLETDAIYMSAPSSTNMSL